MPDGQTIRRVLIEVVEELNRTQANSLQAASILQATAERLGIKSGGRDREAEQALLTIFHDLFRSGYLAWGLNLSNVAPPFCHVTTQGRATLQNFSRDPANPDGYLAHLQSHSTLNPISASYLNEALVTYNAGCYKATAVMIGAAAESCILELRDALVTKLTSLSKPIPQGLNDWQIKRVLDALKNDLDTKKGAMTPALREVLEANWPAFTQQIRRARNDAGHPNTIDPVTPETVYASLLIFPELAKLASELRTWIGAHYT